MVSEHLEYNLMLSKLDCGLVIFAAVKEQNKEPTNRTMNKQFSERQRGLMTKKIASSETGILVLRKCFSGEKQGR